nr:MAG TPA: hypothetical protein [Caudoviricetes sp.]
MTQFEIDRNRRLNSCYARFYPGRKYEVVRLLARRAANLKLIIKVAAGALLGIAGLMMIVVLPYLLAGFGR